MSGEKPHVLLITSMETVCRVFENNLRVFFGSKIEIDVQFESRRLDKEAVDRADLILLSSRDLLDQVPVEKRSVPVLVARRTVDLTKLDRLMDVDSGTRCLMVSNSLEMVDSSIELLQRLGFDHLHFIPYVPGDTPLPEPDQVDLAVCHGLPELVPDFFDNVIELGHRPIDLTTIFDIARLLNLSLEKANLYTAEFMSDFVRLGRKLTNSVSNERRLNQKLESILNAVHEGIMGIDSSGNITVLNKDAERILKLTAAVCVGKHFTEVVPDFQVEEVFATQEEVTDQLLQTRNLYLLVTKIPMKLDGQLLGVVVTFQDVTKVQRIEQEIRKKSTQLGLTTKYSFHHIIGSSQSIASAKQAALKLAESDFTILITGENGTGKEVFAQAIHHHSPRREGPFVPVNFAGLTESLAESELFGYEEGAFTGARKGGKMGLFELAHNGTIFLDEIGDAPLSIQAALLRVLQERQVMRVGGNRVIPINVRVIAATNRNLDEMVRNGTFREDLYYRLNVLPLYIPPLRDRREDLFRLIDYYLQKKEKRLVFAPEVKNALVNYAWPGNIRELENFIHYLAVIVEGNRVEMEHLPERIVGAQAANQHADQQQKAASSALDQPELAREDDYGDVEDVVHYISRHGSLTDYQDILANLWTCSKRQERVGRNALQSMLARPQSVSQIRQKLMILSRAGCVVVGVKKQGTEITEIGVRVLERLKGK